MADRQQVEAFLAAGGPILDVRSPGEFARGHIPASRNLPLFEDEERAEVGTTYARDGRESAIHLGLSLVGPRLAELGRALAGADPDPGRPLCITCWRGGMRSASVAWLAETVGRRVVLLEGGYKAYRRWVLARFERPWPLRLLGGRTGTGKTDLLLALQRRGVAVVDLEGLASHRGSSFGGLGLPPQPSVEQFENLLAATLERWRGAAEIWLEAESIQVGRCRIPGALFARMAQAPLLEIRRPHDWRVAQLVRDYGHQDPEGLRQATERIGRRLGPQRSRVALEAIAARDWAAAARQMLDYYDRCYDHELGRRPALRSVSLGDRDAASAADLLLRQGHCRPASDGHGNPA
jgi:tRNA 2-selenouridine synthase